MKSIEPNSNIGTVIKIFSISKANYNFFYDSTKDYMANALSIFTIRININNELLGNEFRCFFEKIQSLFNYPSDQYEIYLRSDGDNLSLDFINLSGALLNQFLDLGIDFSEFSQFKLLFKSQFIISNFFSLSWDDFLFKILSSYLEIKATSTNIKYILISFIKTLEKVISLENKKNEKLFQILLLYKFLSFTSDFSFDQKELSKALFYFNKSNNNNKNFNSFKTEIKKSISAIKPFLEKNGLTEYLKKIIYINNFSFVYAFPKYQNGFVFYCKLTELGKFLIDNIFN